VVSGGVKRPSIAHQPPSTNSCVAVTYELASEARKITAPAISRGCAQRPSAVLRA
jgi:hypothetical protein